MFTENTIKLKYEKNKSSLNLFTDKNVFLGNYFQHIFVIVDGFLQDSNRMTLQNDKEPVSSVYR